VESRIKRSWSADLKALSSIIYERYNGAAKGKAIVEIIKNPSRYEINGIKSQQKYGDEIGAIFTKNDIYIFRRDLDFHKNVAKHIGLTEYIGILLGDGYAMVTDATTDGFKNNPLTAKIIRKLDPNITEISYYNEAIVGDWEEIDTEQLRVAGTKMNWYKKAKEREFPVAAVISAAGRLFEGRFHGEALKKAIDSGYAMYDNNVLKDKNGKDMAYDGSIDLFRTNKGRIIDRFEASKLGEATGAEHIPEKEVDTLEKIVKKYEAMGVDIYAYDDGRAITLSNLRVPKENRNEGVGTNFMNELCDYADRTKKQIELNLGDKEPGETTSKGRLIEFYKRFGFVRNFGRTVDYRLSCQMYRKPR